VTKELGRVVCGSNKDLAGGLPPGITMSDFLTMITAHVRDDFASAPFDPALSHDDFRGALMSIDGNIRHYIVFLNGVVHQAAAGEVHRALW
jgi:hypothetical protein